MVLLIFILLVGKFLDLTLQLVNESLHSFMVLLIFILLIGKFLDLTLRLSQSLLGIIKTSVLSIKFRFQLTNTGIHFTHGFLATLKSILLSFIKLALHVLGLGLKKLALALKTLSRFLFSSKLFSKASSINHSLLGLLLRQGSFRCHFIKIRIESVHFTIKLHLGTLDGLVGASLISKSLIGVSKFLFNHASSTVRLLKHGASLLKSILVGMSLS